MPGSGMYLGVDGGASNITMAVVDTQGKVLAQHLLGGGANYHAVGLEVAVEHLEEVMQGLLTELAAGRTSFSRAVFGLAGCNFPSDRELLTRALRSSSMATMLGGGFDVVNDARVALRAGTDDGVGVVLIAGTGSNCYGRDGKGKEARAGGIDHILSDEGSGYDIGLRGLRAVVAELDGRGEATQIKQRLYARLRVRSLEELYARVYGEYVTKPRIASLAVTVCECAADGDIVARDILNHSVNELLSLVDAVLRRLEWQDTVTPVVMVGSILQEPYIAQRLKIELLRIAPKAKVVRPGVSSAVGAAWMAKEVGL